MPGPQPAAPRAPSSPPMRRRPRKFVPRTVTPEWREWAKEEAENFCRTLRVHPSWYFPEDHDKAIPDDGAWICVIDPPPVSLVNFELPHLSMWRATRFEGRRLAKDLPFPSQQAVINTPGGTVRLWPTEYVIIPDITRYVGVEPDCLMHSLGGQPVLDEERVFYLMSRGINREGASLLLLGEVSGQDFAYFTFAPEYQAMFAGAGVPLATHVARNPRGRTA
ncbi:MAG: hypothetical protein ACOH1Y_11715 [Propionicimonas sp.]